MARTPARMKEEGGGGSGDRWLVRTFSSRQGSSVARSANKRRGGENARRGLRLRFRRKPTYRSGKRKCRRQGVQVRLNTGVGVTSFQLVQDHPRQTSAPMLLPQL